MVNVRVSSRRGAHIFFNARRELWGLCMQVVPSFPAFNVASVVPSWPMEGTPLRPGDVLEAIDGQYLRGRVPDWFGSTS
jgi:C-terminal processing protease CtpA/Prc